MRNISKEEFKSKLKNNKAEHHFKVKRKNSYNYTYYSYGRRIN